MKVYIGPYRGWVGPYQIADFFCKRWLGEDRAFAVGTWLADKTFLGKFCNWIHRRQERTVKVKIHDYDTWNMESTLAILVLPMLKQLKAKQHGAPYTENDDVPEHLHAVPGELPEHVDANHFARWNWIMDQMIWSFEQLQPDCDWEAQFHTGEHDIQWLPSGNGMNEMVIGPKDTHKFDAEGYKLHSARIDLGLKFFGKYYRGLWD